MLKRFNICHLVLTLSLLGCQTFKEVDTCPKRPPNCKEFDVSLTDLDGCTQGCKRDVALRDRDETEAFEVQDRDETKTFEVRVRDETRRFRFRAETRPRR